jgi:hypothetical protein
VGKIFGKAYFEPFMLQAKEKGLLNTNERGMTVSLPLVHVVWLASDQAKRQDDKGGICLPGRGGKERFGKDCSFFFGLQHEWFKIGFPENFPHL